MAAFHAEGGMATPDGIAEVAMSAMTAYLHDAGFLSVPPSPPPELTVADAAKLLCRLSRTRRLDDPENDHKELLDHVSMVEFAWANAIAAGIDPADADAAHAAHRLLEAHHGLR